jgi:hypothetical protein
LNNRKSSISGSPPSTGSGASPPLDALLSIWQSHTEE